MSSPRLALVGLEDGASIDRAAVAAARRVLDAFYLEGRVLPDAEYTPLRDAMRRAAVLRIACRDAGGAAAERVSAFFHHHRARIVATDEHRDLGYWLARIEWQPPDAGAGTAISERFAVLADQLQAQWSTSAAHRPRPRIAIFVSRHLHCLEDLLRRQRDGALDADIALVVSNHADAQPLAAAHGIAFHRFELTAHNQAEVERRQIELLQQQRIDLIVLARYMQILSPNFVGRYRDRIINVHHSLLPAFAGADAHRRAFAHGVRVVGATSHYVTEALDEGPIIEQQAERVSPRARLEDFVACGREMEKAALFRAVHWHVQERIVVYAGKTAVFEPCAA